VLIALAIFVTTFSYTSKQTITGQLVPDIGVIKVYSPQYGVVTEINVKEVDYVDKGDPVLKVSSDSEGRGEKGMQEIISKEIKNRLILMNNELAKLRDQYLIDRVNSEKALLQAKEQLAEQNKQIENYERIINLVSRRQAQYQELYKKQYISLEQVDRVREEYLTANVTLNNLKRERLNTQKEINQRASELQGLDVKFKQQTSQYERN